MKRLIGPVFTLLILVGILYLIVTYTPIRPLFPSLIEQSAHDAGVQVTVGHIYADTPSYRVDAQYPQFGISAVDAQIKKAMEDAIAEFEALPPNPPDSATLRNEFTGTFDKVYVGSDVVSVELILSQYIGGAHNLTLLSGMNFDRATGKLLLLDDVLKLIGKSVQQISQEATAQFTQKFGDAFFADGANDNPENFSSFTISSDKVTFIFQEYQVAAYAAGAQTVTFDRKP